MKQKIWILNHYAGGMFFNKGGRHYAFAKYLKQDGYEPVIFCCNTKHNKPEAYFDTDKLWEIHNAEEIDMPFVFVRARTYTGNGKQRILNMTDFYRNVKKSAKEYAREHGAPDIILASSVHPLTLIAGQQLARHFGVKCICEVRDLWPESIVEYSDKFGRNNPLIKLLYVGEKWIYKKADSLIFSIEGGKQYITDKGWNHDIDLNRVHYINNGVDIDLYKKQIEENAFQDSDLEDDKFKIIYCGSIRKANNLELLLNVAKELPDGVKFLIYGAGEDEDLLKEKCRIETIGNVVFKGKVPKEKIPFVLSKSDLNILNYKNVETWKYGGSQNKMFEYMASGKPILSTVTMGYSLIKKYNCGVEIKDQTVENVVSAIRSIMALPEESYKAMCRNASEGAKDFDFRILTDKLEKVIDRTIGTENHSYEAR